MKIEIDFDVPKGWKFVRYDYPKVGEYYLSNDSGIIYHSAYHYTSTKKFILEKIPKLRKYTFIGTGEFRQLQPGEGYTNGSYKDFYIYDGKEPSLGEYAIYKVIVEDV